jgi:hypothetical protein
MPPFQLGYSVFMTVFARTAFVLSLTCTAFAVPGIVMAQDVPSYDQNVFLFGGRFTDMYFEYSFNPIAVSYENNFVLGGGYQHFLLDTPFGVRLGAEVGTSLRFGDSDPSGEIWGGVVARYDNLLQADRFTVSLAATVGVSATTGTVGVERDREIEENGDSSLLWYFGPEVSITPRDNPNLDFFWRLQHRSGGWESLGSMHDGANANTVGVRLKF